MNSLINFIYCPILGLKSFIFKAPTPTGIKPRLDRRLEKRAKGWRYQ